MKSTVNNMNALLLEKSLTSKCSQLIFFIANPSDVTDLIARRQASTISPVAIARMQIISLDVTLTMGL